MKNNSWILIGKFPKIILMIFSVQYLFAQKLTQRMAIEMAWQQNPVMKIVGLETDSQRFRVGTAKEKPKTSVGVGYGRIQWYSNLDHLIAITQSFNHPKYYKTLTDLLNKQVLVFEQNQSIKKNELAFQVKQIFAKLCYYNALKKVLYEQDSIYKKAKELAIIRRQEGEDSRYEVVTAESELAENELRMKVVEVEEKQSQRELAFLINYQPFEKIDLEIGNFTSIENVKIDNLSIENNPMLRVYDLQKTSLESEISHEKAKNLPEFSLNITNQSIEKRLTPAFFYGEISFPLSSKPLKALTQSLRVNEMIISENQNQFRRELENQLEIQLLNIQKFMILKNHYEQVAMPQDKDLFELVNKKYRYGQALYHEYITMMQKAWENKENYLQNVLDLRQSINEIEYLTGKDL